MVPHFDDTQVMLRDTALAACRNIRGANRPRAVDQRAAWKRFAEMGWIGVALPESLGGSGGTLLDAGIVACELGRGGIFVSYPETVAISYALAGQATLSNSGPKILADTVEGRTGLLLPLALDDPKAGNGKSTGANGSAPSAMALASGPVEFLLVNLVAGSRPNLRAIRLDDIAERPVKSIRRGREVLLKSSGSLHASGTVLLEGDTASSAWELANLAFRCLTCAQLIGSARTIHAMALEYANVRAQFGHVIANYQAVQHALVDIFGSLEGAELLAFKALDTIDKDGAPSALVSAAISYVRDAVWAALMKTYDVFGGVAFIEEHPLSDFTRNMVPLIASLGSGESCLEAVSQTVRKGAFLS